MSDEVDRLVRVCLFYFVEENLGSVDWGGGGGYACDEDLDAMLLEDRGDSAPVGYLKGRDGGAYCDGVEA